jgi:glycine cleavage system H lipoate-binding protein
MKEPWWKRKMRERAEKKAVEKTKQAANIAAFVTNEMVERNDELTQAIAENAKKTS